MSESVQLMARRDNGFITKNTEPGKEYRWMDPDNFGWYHTQNKRLGEDWKYHNSKGELTYTYNTDGFRNDKTFSDLFIPHDDYTVTIGASGVEGIGTSFEDTMAKQIEKRTGTHCYNMGISGLGMLDHVSNFTNLMSNYHAPKAVIMTNNRTQPTSIEVPDKPGYFIKVGPWFEFFKKHIADYRGDEFTDQSIDYYNARLAVKSHLHEHETMFRMIKQLCDIAGSKLIVLETVDIPKLKVTPGISTDEVDWIEASELPILASTGLGLFENEDHDFMMRYTRYKEKEQSAEELNVFARDSYHQGIEYNIECAKRVHAILEKN